MPIYQQDHTSQDHFCSVIDEFPVWNSEPDQPTMMSWAAAPEREEVSELSTEVGYIDDRSSSCHRKMEGATAVWVVLDRINFEGTKASIPDNMKVEF